VGHRGVPPERVSVTQEHRRRNLFSLINTTFYAVQHLFDLSAQIFYMRAGSPSVGTRTQKHRRRPV
jgi:hypothetical protein